MCCHIAAPPECQEEQFACNEYKWNHTYCIPVHQRCDKIDDCTDKSDESGCCKHATILICPPWSHEDYMVLNFNTLMQCSVWMYNVVAA